jgi:hypothetical protein
MEFRKLHNLGNQRLAVQIPKGDIHAGAGPLSVAAKPTKSGTPMRRVFRSGRMNEYG